MAHLALISGLILLVVCGGGVIWLLLFSPRRKPVTIPLGELSKLWLSEDSGEVDEVRALLWEALSLNRKRPKPPPKPAPSDEETRDSKEQSLDSSFRSSSERVNPPTWANNDTNAFYKEFVEPYEKVIGEKALKSVVEILKLLDREGDCSSVVSGESWGEEKVNIYSALERVSLRTHSFNTARYMLEILKREYSDFEMVVGKGLIAALGHDLGKIPRLKKAYYSTGDHPINSAMVVGACLLYTSDAADE